jgi:hypothetical protein
MGIGVTVLMETKVIDNRYPKTAAGYTIMCSKAASCAQGRVVLVWKEDDLKFKVELVLIHGLNTLTFQLATGDEQFHVVGTYIPPHCTRGVEDLQQVAEACPAGCKLLVMGDLNVNVEFPCDKREEVIVDLLDTAIWETHRVGISYRLCTGPPPGHDGHGAKKGGQHDTTQSQITSWCAQRKWAF